MLKEGLFHTSRLVVGECDTAERMGSGDMPVLATPRMMALMENAAMLAVAAELQDGDTTVGAHIGSPHLAPTPVGAEVSATAVLTKIEGRKLHFEIEARQGDTLIGKATHLRVIVNRAKFLSKVYPWQRKRNGLDIPRNPINED